MPPSFNPQSIIRTPQSKGPDPVARQLEADLLRRPEIQSALSYIDAAGTEIEEELIRICEIPAPPFKERARAGHVQRRFTELGLQRVRIDREGNVIGERPGRFAAPGVIVSAHLDTV